MLTLTDDKLLKFVLILGKSCVAFVWGEKLGCPRTLFIILLKKLGDETSQIGFEKMFKPITSKLDESIASNLRPRSSFQPRKKKAQKAEIDYFPEVDPFEDMDVEGLFEDPVPPQSKK